MPNPQLWPAILVAIAGFLGMLWASYALARGWRTLKRRWWLVAALAVFEAAYWVNIYAWFIEPNMLVVRRVEIVSAQWHGAPLTIAALGDTHVGGPHVDAARMGRIVRRVNALHPDIVMLLGDYVNGHAPESDRTPAENQEIIGGIATFAALDARYGVVGVLGNHDSWYSRQSIVSAMENAGIATLWNRNVLISREGGDFVVAGLEDLWTGHPDFAAALDGAPAGADTIVLAHNPDIFAQMPPGPAMLLAAHTHCGQVTIPFIGRTQLPIHHKEYACRRVDNARGQTLFVTAGIGTSILPVRFLNPPEIVLITLRSNRPSPNSQSFGAG